MNSKSERSNTGYRGVHFRKEKDKFTCAIKVPLIHKNEWITINIGSYDTVKEALTAREEFIKSLF